MLIIHCKFFKTVVTVTTTSEYNRGDDFLRLKREELWTRNYQSVEFGANFHSWNIYHICHIHMVFKFSWEKFWSHVPHTYGFQIFSFYHMFHMHIISYFYHIFHSNVYVLQLISNTTLVVCYSKFVLVPKNLQQSQKLTFKTEL